MEETEFFERMGPQFAAQASGARANAKRQADVERLISKAEYEFDQVRRELVGLVPAPAEPCEDAQVIPAAPTRPAKAA